MVANHLNISKYYSGLALADDTPRATDRLQKEKIMEQ
jgi:hypothetical protein